MAKGRAERKKNRADLRLKQRPLARWGRLSLEALESRLAPTTGILALDDLSLTPADRTLIQIGGLQVGNPPGGNDSDGYDRLQVANTASLDGTLQLSLVNNFIPAVGAEFEILTAGTALSGAFHHAEGLFSIPGGDRYFRLVQEPHTLKLVVTAAPGGLTFTPATSARDSFGEFLNDDYFHVTQFTYTGTISAPRFVDLAGTFAFEDRGSTVVAGSSDAAIFLGTAYGASNQTGLQLSDAQLGLVLTDTGHAMTASGSSAFVGLAGLNIAATFDVQTNTTGQAVHVSVPTPAGSVVVQVDAEDDNGNAPRSFAGTGTISVSNQFTLEGDIALTEIATGMVLVDVTDMQMSLTTGDLEVFRFGGLVRFGMDHHRGFQLLDTSFNDVHVLGVDVLPGASSVNSLTYPDDELGPVQFTSLFDAVDVAVLNRRRYLDLTFQSPTNQPIDPDSILDNDPEFLFSGSAFEDAVVDYVVQLDTNTFRYYLIDGNTSNTADSFKHDLFRVNENFSNTRLNLNIIANSWKDTDGVGNAATVLGIDVRSGITVTSSDVELGPLVLKGPFFNVEELQFKPLANPADGATLVTSVAVGVDEASLKFGGDSPKLKTGVTGLLGTFGVETVVTPAGIAGASPRLRVRVDKVEVEIKDVVKASATGVYVTFDPLKDRDHDGIVSSDEQTAYNQQEIVRVDSASVEIPKINLTGSLNPYTRPSPGIDPNTGQVIPGTTIPGLSVRNDGFRLGEASLHYAGDLSFGGMVQIKGVAAGVQDLGVTFGQEFEFDGAVFIAADEAILFPGKKFEMKLTDGPDSDSEAVRTTLKFTDNLPSGFAFKVDTGDLKFGNFLTVHASNFEIDTTNTPPFPVVNFGSLAATISAGPLKLGGEIRDFGFLNDGTIRTGPAFGVFVSVDKVDGKSFQWPDWLPIRPTEFGIQWRDLQNHPEEFKLIVSAAVESIKGLPKLDFSGSIQGIEIDVGLLQQGQFPITGIESMGVSVSGDLFGGKVNGGLIGGIIKLDSTGAEISPLDQITPIADRVFFLGVEGGFTISGQGGFTLRFALTEKGPLGVQVTGDLPEGILLEPISGLKLSGFSGGVEFFKSLPDAYKPEDLLDPNFAPALTNASKLDADQWLQATRRQVIAQYNSLKENPVAGGFLAAFRNPLLISGGGQIVFHTPESVLKINAEVRISVDPNLDENFVPLGLPKVKLLLTGDILLFGGLQRSPARIFADLSKIEDGTAKLLLMAQDIPAGTNPLLLPVPIPMSLELRGAVSLKYFGPNGEEVDFYDDTPTPTSPTAQLIDPAQDGQISQGKLSQNRYVDVQFSPSPDATLDAASITDADPELVLVLPDGTRLTLGGAAVHPEGAAENVYRFTLPGTLAIDLGEYEIRLLPGSWQDSLGQQGAEQLLRFAVVGATVELAGPTNNDRIDRAAIHQAGRLAIRFQPTPGAVLDLGSILDAAPEVALTGPASAGVSLGQPVRDLQDDLLFYYPFTGTFGVGPVGVTLLDGAWTDSQGNVSGARSFAFTVTGPEVRLRDPADGTTVAVAELNQRGYLEVYFTPSGGVAVDPVSLTDAAPEFVLSGAGAGVSVSGVAVPVPGEPNVYRYALLSAFTQAGAVTVEFLGGSFQDLQGVASASRTESFRLEGVAAHLVSPAPFSTAGVTLLNSRGYLDVRFTPTAGATLDEAAILDAAAEFTLEGLAAADVVIDGAPTPLGNGLYRYAFTGVFQPGAVTLRWIASAAADSAGFLTTPRADTFRLEVPAVELASPSDRLRVDRSKINDAGYIDVRFLDRTGRGLAEASITDADAEFQLLVLDESGQNWIVHPQVGVNGAALRNPDGSYRYFFSNAFNPGVVRVQFLEGSFTDVDGAANLAAEQQFVVVNNAPSFEFQIEGHLVYRTGFKSRLFGDLSNPDQVRDLLKMLEPIVGEIGGNDEAGMQALRDFVAGIDTGLSIIQPFLTQPLITLDGFIRFGSEMLVGPASEILGARTTLDISGAIGVYLLGPVGAAAGRIVLQVDGHGINVWGVAELRAELKVLRKAGIDLQAFGVLQFNTTGVEQVESLTLKGMGPNGSDLTQTYQIEPYSLMVAAAGKMIFSVPTFNDAAPFGQEMFRINAVASLNISSEGLAMFVKGDLEIGPPDVRLLDIDALGVFIINDQGFAGDVQVSATVGDIPALKDYLQLDVSARVVFNVTGQAQQVKILDRFLDFLTPEFKALLVDIENPLPPGYTQTFANTATKAYVVPAAPPPPPVDDGTPAPAGPYIVIAAQGNLMVGGAFRLHGDFYFEVNATPEMFVTLNGSIALDPLGAAAISGTFHIDRHGAYGGLQIGASLDVGPLSVFGAAQFEFNTQAIPAQVARYRFDFDRGQVTDEREIVTLGPGAFRIHVAGHLKLANSFDLQGQFLLENQPDIIAVHIDAKFDAFGANLLTVNGDAAIVKTGATGFVANLAAQAQAPFALDGVFEMQANFLLQINTRTGNAQDAYDLGLARDSFLVRFDGSLNLLSVLELSGSGFIEYKLGVFRMQVAMQTSFFGLASLSASGFFSSEGEFDLYLGGSFSIGAPGFLGVQAGGNIHISLLDSNGTEAFGDGNTVLRVNGGLGGTFWVFGFSFGANVGVNFASDTGVLSITPSITINLLFFSITHSTTFNLGVLKVNPPVYVAGNADDTFGQAFRGGALYLNMGPRAALRNYDVTETGEHFSIEYVGPDPDQGGHIVRVTGNGLRRTYRGVTEIIADGGTGRDLIETDAALPVPVTFRGGAENDRLLHRGSGPAFLQGGDGQDEIETHANVGPVFLDGGGDSDTLRHLGTAPATLVGGFGDDTIQGGLGDDRFVFAEGYGYDLLTDAGGIATLDFDTAVSSLHGSLTTAGALINGSSTTRLHSADAFVRVDDGSELLGPTYAPVRLVHDGGHRLVVQHAGHPFAEGDEIEIATPDSTLGTALRTKARWRITEVTAAGYVLELPADQTNRGVVAKVYYYDDAGVSRSRDTVILHDGNRTATVYHPDHPVAVGDTIYLVSPEASYYNGEFTVTAVGADWYALDVPFDLVRDSASTDFGVANLVLGLGDDRIDTDVAQAVETTLTDRRFGKDEVFVSGPFPSAVTLEAGRFLASDLRLTFAEGIDRLTLFSPTQALTLNSATGTADLGALGLRVVADLVDLNTAIDAGHLVLESRATITVDHPVNVSHDGYIDLRVFGDSADIVLEQPLTVSTGDSQDGLGDGWIRLLAPDGSITGSQALSFVAPNSHLIYKAKNAPTGTLQTHLEKLTFAYGPHGTPGDVSIVEQDGLILTSLDDYDTPFAPDLVYGDGTFAGITWLTTAPAGWLDQMRGGSTPGGSSPFALVVPAGALRLQLLAEDSLLYLESGQITTQAAGQDMTFLADDVSFRSGAAQVIGTGRLSIQANQAVWNYRLGTAGENAAGSDLLRSAFARSMDLTSGDLAALADGFAQITIGRSDAGNTMVLGDAMDAEFIKFTGQERLRDARFRDPTLLLTDTLTVAGDVEATGTLEIRAAGSAVVEGPNLHVPTGGIDSGLEALQLILQVGQDLQVNGWLLAAALLDVAVHGEVTIDVGARLETRNDDNTFRLDAGGNLSIAGEVKAGGLRGKPQLNADGAIYLREGGSISAPGAGAQIDIQSDVRVTMEPGTAVLAGVTFDHSTGSPIPTVTGAGSSVRIRSPQELFLPGTVAASDGITLEGGPSTLDYSAYFQSRFPSEHPLHARSHYAILVTGTLLTFGDARDLVLSSTDDVIISGNIDLRGAGSNLILQSDRSLFVEGFTTLASGNITLYGGVALDGTDRVGADETSVTVYEGSLLTTGNASSRIDVRGATNIALLGSLVAGGTVTSTGIHWASPGDAAITVRAGQQIPSPPPGLSFRHA
ncbi:MAG: hypothetical protein U0840_12825 [Gemmataceae bacterium]